MACLHLVRMNWPLSWDMTTMTSIAMCSALVGGTHHAFRDRGEGFCAFNDIAVGAATVMAEHALERILVIDLDVHQACLTTHLSVIPH